MLAAAEREFSEHGPLDATLARIRQSAGASVGALYHHFPDKADLYRQVWEYALADYQRCFWGAVGESADARSGVVEGVRAHLRWVSENPHRATILLSARPPGVRESESNRTFLTDVARWWRTHAGYGTVRALDFDVLYALWLGPAQEYSRQWTSGAIPVPPTEVGEELAEAAWLVLGAPSATTAVDTRGETR